MRYISTLLCNITVYSQGDAEQLWKYRHLRVIIAVVRMLSILMTGATCQQDCATSSHQRSNKHGDFIYPVITQMLKQQ